MKKPYQLLQVFSQTHEFAAIHKEHQPLLYTIAGICICFAAIVAIVAISIRAYQNDTADEEAYSDVGIAPSALVGAALLSEGEISDNEDAGS